MAEDKDTPTNLPAFGIGEVDPQFMRSPGLAIWFDDALFQRAKQIATYLSKAEGFVPPHLVGKPEACFAVVERSLNWKLSPYAVAQSTYQTPGGRVGFEGKLCQAALENSGRMEGGVKFEHYGDWSKVEGKFEIARSQKGNEYAKRTWTREDAVGLGVIVRAKLRGEPDPREWKFDLTQAWPLNSTLWATDPRTQICYAAVRRFANVAAPGLFMGVEFDREGAGEEDEMVRAAKARDVTPPKMPTRDEFDQPSEEATPASTSSGPPAASSTAEEQGNPVSSASPGPKNVTEGGSWFAIIGVPDGEVLMETEDGGEFTRLILSEAKRLSADKGLLDGLWESNSNQFKHLDPANQKLVREGWPKWKDGKLL